MTPRSGLSLVASTRVRLFNGKAAGPIQSIRRWTETSRTPPLCGVGGIGGPSGGRPGGAPGGGGIGGGPGGEAGGAPASRPGGGVDPCCPELPVVAMCSPVHSSHAPRTCGSPIKR